MEKRITITVAGRVQGIFFRKTTKQFSDRLNLTGYAKNLADGRVEICAEGEEENLRRLLDWSYRGSSLAKVESLSFKWSKATGNFKEFSVRKDGKNYLKDKASAVFHLSKNILGLPEKIIPKHVVIIPDGNRRWAKEKGRAPWNGHKAGIEQTIDLFGEARKIGIKYFTLWGFSSENWGREKKEVDMLLDIFYKIIPRLKKDSVKHQVSVHHFGRKDRLPKKLASALAKLEEETKEFSRYHFGIALDYGGRDEILRAFNKLNGEKKVLTEKNISLALDTNGFPDPDLIIRTGGEQRLSGLMPWQSVYSELYFSPLYFPDFSPLELRYAVHDYTSRHRRFGS